MKTVQHFKIIPIAASGLFIYFTRCLADIKSKERKTKKC